MINQLSDNITNEIEIDRNLLAPLNDRQYAQILKQVRHHNYEKKVLDVYFKEIDHIQLEMLPGVLEPMSSRLMAQYISSNQTIFMNKTVYDIGTGSGIQAICAKIAGANKIVASDVSRQCINCAKINFDRVVPKSEILITHADLFGSSMHNEKVDIILFAQPLFGANPIEDFPVTRGMLDDGELIHRFLQDSQNYLKPDGKIYMVAWDFSGPINDPLTQIKKHQTLQAKSVLEMEIQVGVQQGKIAVIEISWK